MTESNNFTQAIARQAQAANPNYSVIVSANAGSGKTRVLTNRYLLLLLADPTLSPAAILTVTFTRLAAHEMRERIFTVAQSWEMLPTTELSAELQAIWPEQQVTDLLIEAARGLHERLLAVSEQLKILTLDAWCQQIVQQLSPALGRWDQLTIIRDDERADILNELMQQVIAAPDLAEHIQFFTGQSSLFSLSDLTSSIIHEKVFQQLQQQPLERVLASIAAAFEVNVDLTPSDLQSPMITVEHQEFSDLKEVAAAMVATGKGRAKTQGEVLQNHLTAGQITASDLHAVFHTGKGELYKFAESIIDLTNPVVMLAEQLLERYFAARSYLLTAAFYRIAASFYQAYQQYKQDHALADFDDITHQAKQDLHDPQLGEIRQYQLDSQIQHILLDEAQDTDPLQWQILTPLIQEILAGEGQYEMPRTIFIVGDEKQSIYRFRGAASQVFQEVLAWQAPHLQQLSLQTSFRSAPAVLRAVDEVCADKFGDHYQSHVSISNAAYGQVVVWEPLDETPQRQTVLRDLPAQPWSIPVPVVSQVRAVDALAERIASECFDLINNGFTSEQGAARAIDPSDIMILFRSRGAEFQAVQQALSRRGVPHSGRDRFCLNLTPLVADLIWLLEWCIAPDYDLALASILRSPLFRWGDQQLEELSQLASTHETSWWQALQRNNEIAAQLHSIYAWSQVLDPARLIRKVASQLAFIPRYAKSTADTPYSAAFVQQEKLLQEVLIKSKNFSNIVTFLEHLKKDKSEVKSAVFEDKSVRLQTIHGAKGLEAPIIFMAQTSRKIILSNNDRFLFEPQGNWLLLRTSKEQAPKLQHQLMALEEERLLQDEKQLLYVAMTRARERLYIAGTSKNGVVPEQSWYSWVMSAAKQHNWRQTDEGYVLSSGELPPALQREGSVEESLVKPAWFDEVLALPEHKSVNQAAVDFGTAVHELLEYLPAVKPDQRRALGEKLLAQTQLDDSNQAVALKQAQQVMAKLPELFGENSQAEVEIVGTSGQLLRLDRLVKVAEDEYWVIDFKTDHPVPTAVPEQQRAQLQKYAETLSAWRPNTQIKCGLVYTHNAQLVWL